MRRCARCAATTNLEIHHVVPRCNGGGDGATQALCHDCHVRLHAAAGHYAAWGLAGAQAVLAQYGAAGRAFLQEIGARGGRTVVERYGLEYLRELGRRGGQATARKNGHLQRLATRRDQTMAQSCGSADAGGDLWFHFSGPTSLEGRNSSYLHQLHCPFFT
jgi:general stress protein YciG